MPSERIKQDTCLCAPSPRQRGGQRLSGCGPPSQTGSERNAAVCSFGFKPRSQPGFHEQPHNSGGSRRRGDSIDSDGVCVGLGLFFFFLSGARKITKEMGWKFSVCTNQNL